VILRAQSVQIGRIELGCFFISLLFFIFSIFFYYWNLNKRDDIILYMIVTSVTEHDEGMTYVTGWSYLLLLVL